MLQFLISSTLTIAKKGAVPTLHLHLIAYKEVHFWDMDHIKTG